jgi:hypothetical protein
MTEMSEDLGDPTERFRQLGAIDPESWARSETDEDIAQLARFVFLRQLWELVIPSGGFAIAALRYRVAPGGDLTSDSTSTK